MSEVLLSVCLPAYNAERYIEQAVQSIFAQTFRDFELLVIDDGSTDGTKAVLERLSREDSRLRFKSRGNLGLIATLNELLHWSRGTYIARMDADDLSRKERFRRQLDHLQRNPGCVAVGCRLLHIDPEGLPFGEFVDLFEHEEIESALMRTALGISHPALMMRRTALERIGGYYRDYLHAEDLDLLLRLGEVGRLENLKDVLLEYRCHLASISHIHNQKQSESALRAVGDARFRRGIADSPPPAPRATQPETTCQLHQKWAWWSIGAGHVRTARKHARLAFVTEPLNRGNFKLLAFVLRDSLKALRFQILRGIGSPTAP